MQPESPIQPSAIGARGAALAAIQLGKLDDAERLATEEVKLARRFGAPGALGVALRAHGLVQGGAAGIDLLRDATTSLERSRSRLEHARALVDLGAAIRRRGRRADARKPLAQGLDMAHRVGATIVVRQARDELLASGARPRRAALRGVQALTPSEHRVAQMAAAGNSNREIAQALFVTLRTVEGQLTRAYDKLGIRSREQLLAALALPSASRRLNPGD